MLLTFNFFKNSFFVCLQKISIYTSTPHHTHNVVIISIIFNRNVYRETQGAKYVPFFGWIFWINHIFVHLCAILCTFRGNYCERVDIQPWTAILPQRWTIIFLFFKSECTIYFTVRFLISDKQFENVSAYDWNFGLCACCIEHHDEFKTNRNESCFPFPHPPLMRWKLYWFVCMNNPMIHNDSSVKMYIVYCIRIWYSV